MRKRIALVAALASVVPAGHAAHASPGDIGGSAGALVGARRVDGASRTSPRPAVLDAPLGEVLALTNVERAAHGLAPLRHDVRLSRAAQAHSVDQAARDVLSHTGGDGSSAGDRIERAGYGWGMWAENVAAGYPSASAVVAGWMRSPGHRANILRTSAVDVGLGVAESAGGRPYWTQVLSAPR